MARLVARASTAERRRTCYIKLLACPEPSHNIPARAIEEGLAYFCPNAVIHLAS
jgi:hypothetical protein